MTDYEPLSARGQVRRLHILGAAKAQARLLRHRRHLRGAAMGVLVVAGLGMAIARDWPGAREARPTAMTTPARPSRPTKPGATLAPPSPRALWLPLVARSARAVHLTAHHPSPRRMPRARPVLVQYVHDDLILSKKWAVHGKTTNCFFLSDDELLRVLSRSGHPAGLAWVDGRTLLLFRNAADPGDGPPPRPIPIVHAMIPVMHVPLHPPEKQGPHTVGA